MPCFYQLVIADFQGPLCWIEIVYISVYFVWPLLTGNHFPTRVHCCLTIILFVNYMLTVVQKTMITWCNNTRPIHSDWGLSFSYFGFEQMNISKKWNKLVFVYIRYNKIKVTINVKISLESDYGQVITIINFKSLLNKNTC